MVDLRKYAPKFIKPEHLREGPITSRIVRADEESQYGNLIIELETGSKLNLKEANFNTLTKAFGWDSENFIGQEVTLELDHYEDWKTKEMKETVKLIVTGSASAAGTNGSAPASKPLPAPMSPPKNDMDDEIPF